jgi:hypothetical protein
MVVEGRLLPEKTHCGRSLMASSDLLQGNRLNTQVVHQETFFAISHRINTYAIMLCFIPMPYCEYRENQELQYTDNSTFWVHVSISCMIVHTIPIWKETGGFEVIRYTIIGTLGCVRVPCWSARGTLHQWFHPYS